MYDGEVNNVTRHTRSHARFSMCTRSCVLAGGRGTRWTICPKGCRVRPQARAEAGVFCRPSSVRLFFFGGVASEGVFVGRAVSVRCARGVYASVPHVWWRGIPLVLALRCVAWSFDALYKCRKGSYSTADACVGRVCNKLAVPTQ